VREFVGTLYAVLYKIHGDDAKRAHPAGARGTRHAQRPRHAGLRPWPRHPLLPGAGDFRPSSCGVGAVFILPLGSVRAVSGAALCSVLLCV